MQCYAYDALTVLTQSSQSIGLDELCQSARATIVAAAIVTVMYVEQEQGTVMRVPCAARTIVEQSTDDMKTSASTVVVDT